MEGRDHARRSLYLADLRRARQSIRDGELGEAGRILRLHVPGVDEGDQRSWEWYYLLARSEREVSKQSNLASGIQRVRWSPDGRWLATAGNPNRKVVRIYEGAAFRLHKTWLADAAVSQISWAPDSQHVALSLGNGKVQKWGIADGVMDFEIAGSAADWSHDGSMIACGPTNSQIVIYDAQSGEVKSTIKGTLASKTFRGLAWNPDNRRIAVTSAWSGQVFDVQTGEAVATIRYPNKGGFSTSRCAWSPDGKELAFGYGYGVFLVCVWNADSGKTRWYDGHFDHVLDVAWNTDGTQLASASNDRRIQIRDSQSGEVLRTLTGHASQVRQLAWRPGDDMIISVSREPQLGVWPLDSRPLPSRKLGGSGVEVTSLSWDSTRDRLVSSEPGATRIWDTAAGKELRAIQRHSGGADVAAWRPHGDWIATSAKVSGSSLEHLQIFSADGRGHILSLPTARRIWGVDWSPDGKYVVGVGAHHEVSVYDVESGELAWRLPNSPGNSGYMVGVSWSPDGTRLALCKERQPSSVWSFESRTKLCDLEYSGNGWAIAWSPDSRRIARATKSATIDILDALTGKRSMRLQGHRGWVRGVDWSPDGRRLASASNDRSVRVWNAQTGEEILILRGHEAPACAVAWRPNNEQLASGDEQGVIRIWDARQGYASARGRVIPWWVVGMYPADVEASFPPERAIDPTAGVTHPDGAERNWYRVTTSFDGEIDFNAVSAATRDLHPEKLANEQSQQAKPGDRSAYAQTFVYSTQDQSVNVWLGHDAGARLWLNGQEVYRHQAGNRNYADASHLTIGLKTGWNRLLARVWDGQRAFALHFRLTGADGQRNLEGVQFSHYPGAETLPEIGAPAPFREKSPSADREMAELALRLGAPVEIDGHVVSSAAICRKVSFSSRAWIGLANSRPRPSCFPGYRDSRIFGH